MILGDFFLNFLETGGDNGAETVTWDKTGDSVYLLAVHDYSGDHKTHLVQSEARVAIYSKKRSSPITMEVPTKDTNTHSR